MILTSIESHAGAASLYNNSIVILTFKKEPTLLNRTALRVGGGSFALFRQIKIAWKNKFLNFVFFFQLIINQFVSKKIVFGITFSGTIKRNQKSWQLQV